MIYFFSIIVYQILKSHQMALFSFHILFKELNKYMLMVPPSDADLAFSLSWWSCVTSTITG